MRVYQILTSPISFHFVLYFTENKSDLDFKKKLEYVGVIRSLNVSWI